MGIQDVSMRLGTMGFSYKDWVGPFYPAGTAARSYLAEYARVFDTVELDTTFYASPPPSSVAHWGAVTPPGFLFTAKAPRSITHGEGLAGAGDALNAFLRAMAPLEEKLGPLLIQLPPQYHADRLDDLKRFLPLLPAEFRFAIEFRHRSWLDEEVFDLLRRQNIALVSDDLFYMPRRLNVTADWIYIRWLGRRADVTKFDRVTVDRSGELEWWATALDGLPPEVGAAYGYFNNHFAGHSPASVNHFRRLLGLPAGEPQQLSLFD